MNKGYLKTDLAFSGSLFFNKKKLGNHLPAAIRRLPEISGSLLCLPLCPTLFPNNTLPSPRIQFSPNPLYNAVIPISI
ncbi:MULTISPECIES: hypothetical protein [Eikenella]|uniref:Uncharacterized protein n=1 Tax=Eikenella exigua TaxID=2528037 RepID=A0AAX1F828_9NEIS|nr:MULTISPECIES: hypothetical protein [Eikenella]QED92226.1 hypothetical protein EZJ17_06085 [Eikenella exigua]